MKKLLTVVLLAGFLLACNNDNTPAKEATAGSPETNHHEHSATGDGLILNNGAKWKADSSTNINGKSILDSIEKFNPGVDKSLAVYTALSGDLQQGLNKMISDCKMQGADHEALHKWLEPLPGQVSELKEASTVVDAQTILEAIHSQVKLYPQYFE